jgi:hypothetical protein
MSIGDHETKTCNDGGYCQHKVYSGSLLGCSYHGYCDFQRPKDSRMQPLYPVTYPSIPLETDICICGKGSSTIPCPLHGVPRPSTTGGV